MPVTPTITASKFPDLRITQGDLDAIQVDWQTDWLKGEITVFVQKHPRVVGTARMPDGRVYLFERPASPEEIANFDSNSVKDDTKLLK